MRTNANTLVRMVSWASFIFGVLFTFLQAWLVGVPLLSIGLAGVAFTSGPSVPVGKSRLSKGNVTVPEKNDPNNPYFIADDSDAANPFFRSVGDRLDDPTK